MQSVLADIRCVLYGPCVLTQRFGKLFTAAMMAAVAALVVTSFATPASADQPSASRNEVLLTRVFDGTASWANSDSSLNPLDNGTDAPADHVPGDDSGSTNNVVRTWDLFGVRVDWNVNDAEATDVVLDVTLTVRDRAPAPSEADVSWKPDITGMFAGCGDGSSISDDGLTLSCHLGDRDEGSQGTIRPIAALGAGLDGSVIDVDVVMTTAEDAAGVADALETPVTVSEVARGTWVKNDPVVTAEPIEVDGESGYVVLFPIGLVDQTASSPRKGDGPLDYQGAITFYDHAWNFPEGAALATQGQLDAANDAGYAVYGEPCGSYDALNAGPFPAATQGAWVCGEPDTSLGYTAFSMTIDRYASEPAATNADGTANAANYVITGQMVFWFPEPPVADAIEASEDGAVTYDNVITATDLSTPVTSVNQDIDPIAIPATTSLVAETITSDNWSEVTLAASGSGVDPTGGGSITGTGTNHWAMITNPALDEVVDNETNWFGYHETIYASRTFAGNSYFWSGTNEVSRGTPVNLQMGVTMSANGGFTESVAGCMTWDPEQIFLTEMPDIEVFHRYADGTTGFTEEAPSGLLEDFTIGQASGSFFNGPYRPARLVEWNAATLASVGVHIEYGYDTGATSYTDSVGMNSVECNNSTDRVWIDSADVANLQVEANDPHGIYDGRRYSFGLVRVRVDEALWSRFTDEVGNGLWGPYPQSMFVLNVSGVIGTDIDVNYSADNEASPDGLGKSVYLHSSRAIGDWDPLAGEAQPPTTSCASVWAYDDVTLHLIADPDDSRPDWPDPDPMPDVNGWCNQPYSVAAEDNDAYAGFITLDTNSFTWLGNFGPGDPSPPRVWDGDHDRVRIVQVRPAVKKTNVDGVQDIKDNGQFVEFDIEVSAVGSSLEALTNVRLQDRLPSTYRFVELVEGPSTPGASCVVPADTARVQWITCQFSELDPDVDTGDLPPGLPGGWSDSIRIRVEVVGAVASATDYARITNTARVDSTGLGPWDSSTGDWLENGERTDDAPQNDSSSAYSFLPFASQEGAILKAIDEENGPCTVNPALPGMTADELADWQERCSTIGLDSDDSNLTADVPSTDGDGNIHFDLTYENTGNSILTNVRFVDVFPYDGDGLGEPDSDSDTNGVPVDDQTNGNGRWPATTATSQLGLVAVNGAQTYWVTADAPGTISRDPNAADDDTTWCDAIGGVIVSGPTDGLCPQNAFEVTAVYAFLGNVRPDASRSIELVLDTEQASCGDLWTNAFGARVDEILLPIRSNDVSAMVACEYDLALNKRVSDQWSPGDDWVTLGETLVRFDLEVVNQGDPVEDVDVTEYLDTDVFSFDIFDNPAGTTEPGSLGAAGTGPELDYAWTVVGGLPVARIEGGLGAGESVVVPVYLTIEALPDGDFENDAEISRFDNDGDSTNGDSTSGDPDNPDIGPLEDVDSTPDATDDDVLIDDELDLTPATGDEDDHDVALLPWWDLALVKDLCDGQSRLLTIADDGTGTVCFTILVKNQGPSTAYDVEVVDTPPAGLSYAASNPSGVQDLSGISVEYAGDGTFTVGELASGEQVAIEVVYDVTLADTDGLPLTNSAEITSFADPAGGPQRDVDSDPDAIVGNDAYVDPERGREADGGEDPDFDADEVDRGFLHNRGAADEDDQDDETVEVLFSLGNQVWNDADNDGLVDEGELPLEGVTVLLFFDEDEDGLPDDRDEDGEVDAGDAIRAAVTDAQGLYLFESLAAGDYVVQIAPENWEPGGALAGFRSSDPTSLDPEDSVDQDDNGYADGSGAIVSAVVTLGLTEPVDEPGPDNDENADPLSNLTVDFGFHRPDFDLALRKTLDTAEVVYTGDVATFAIEVVNQGAIAAVDVAVTDYIPVGLELSDDDWRLGAGRTATIVVAGPIDPGESAVVTIDLEVTAAGDLENFAEISAAIPVDAQGETVVDEGGTVVPDVDSTPDGENGNDVLTDDEIDLTPTTGDEDDHDIAVIRTLVPQSIADSGASAATPVLAVGGAVLLSLGSMLLLMSRFRGRGRVVTGAAHARG